MHSLCQRTAPYSLRHMAAAHANCQHGGPSAITAHGAGAASCVISVRLSEDPTCQVLLVEAGGRDGRWLFEVLGAQTLVKNWPRYAWQHEGQLDLRVPEAPMYGSAAACFAASGPAAHLPDHGIEVMHEAPETGANLHDHAELYVDFEVHQQTCSPQMTASCLLSAGWSYLVELGGLATSPGTHILGHSRRRCFR